MVKDSESGYLTQLRSTAEAAEKPIKPELRVAALIAFSTRWDPATALLVMDVLEAAANIPMPSTTEHKHLITPAAIPLMYALAALRAHVEGEKA
jgi:hypothetical protein